MIASPRRPIGGLAISWLVALTLALWAPVAVAQDFGNMQEQAAPAPSVPDAPLPSDTPLGYKAKKTNRYSGGQYKWQKSARSSSALIANGKTASPAAPPMPGSQFAPDQSLPPFALQSFVDGYVKRSMRSDHVSGAVVVIVQNGQVVLKKGYGLANATSGAPVDPDKTLFRLGSISKTFTWIALMQQVEAGKVRLDAPVNQYLPDSLRIPDKGFNRPVAVRDLMDHTAGFEDRALGQLFEQDPARVRSLSTYLRQEQPRRVRDAGLFPTYSNYGVALAGEIVAQVTQQPFERYVEQEIIGKIGLAHTTFREPYPAMAALPAPMSPDLAQHLSQGFVWTGSGYVARPFEYASQLAPAGSASATASDMGHYMQLILNGGTIDGVTVYGPATARAFRTPMVNPALSQNGWDHGFMAYTMPGGFRGQGHIGATLMFMSNMITVPQLGLGIFVATNTATGKDLAINLPQQIVGQFYASPSTRTLAGSPALAANAYVYNGSYRSTRRSYHGMEKFVGMVLGETHVKVTKDGRLLITDREGTRAYTLSSRPGWLANIQTSEEIRFDEADGRATRYYDSLGFQAYEREGFWQQNRTLAVLAGLTLLASIFLLIGQFNGRRADFRQTASQGRAHLMQGSAAALWVAAMVLFGLWALSASDVTHVFFAWPGMKITLASSCALLASLLSLGSWALIVSVWTGGRRVDSWSTGRKVRFTITMIIFTVFALVLAFQGALAPWSA